MKFFEEQKFPPPNLSPKSRLFAAKYEKITKHFFKQIKKQDQKMWEQVWDYMSDRTNFHCRQELALDVALEGILQQLTSTSECCHRRIEILGELLNIELPIYPFDQMDEAVKAELVDIAQVSFEYYRALQDIQEFMLEG